MLRRAARAEEASTLRAFQRLLRSGSKMGAGKNIYRVPGPVAALLGRPPCPANRPAGTEVLPHQVFAELWTILYIYSKQDT